MKLKTTQKNLIIAWVIGIGVAIYRGDGDPLIWFGTATLAATASWVVLNALSAVEKAADRED